MENLPLYLRTFNYITGYSVKFHDHFRHVQNRKCELIIGDCCFIGTGCIILKGYVLPDYSLLGAASLLNKVHCDIGYLYDGVPARKISEISLDKNLYFSRKIRYVK